MGRPDETPRGDFYEFGPFSIDVSKRSLFRDSEFVPLTPKVFDTLLVLVEESGRVVTKADLLERVWPQAFVEEGSITQNISVLRKILDPYFDGQTPIVTVPRRGYRFTASVRLRNAGAGVILAEPATLPARAPERRWLLAGAAVVGAAALVFAAVRMATQPNSVRPLPRRSIAVLSLKGLAAPPEFDWLSTALAETLTTELGASPELRMISVENVALIRRELSLPASTNLTAKTLGDLRRNLACDLVLIGSYLPLNGQIRLDVKLIDASSGEIVAFASQTDAEKNLLDLVPRTGALLRSKLGIGPLETEQAASLRGSVSANQEAMRLYFHGLTKLREHDGTAAQKSLSQALAADPDFTLAHSALAAAWRQLGYDQKAKQEAKRAFDLSGRLSREERLRVEAQYYETSPEWLKASETYRSLWRFFPDNIEYALQLGSVEFYLNNPGEMLRIADRLRALPPPANADPRIDLLESTAAHLLSDYPRALRAASRAAREAESRKAPVLLASARLKEGNNTDFLGDPDKAREYYAEAARLYESVGDRGQAAYTLRLDAEILVRQGELQKAEEEFAKALAATRSIGFVRMTARVLLGYGNLERQRGNLPAARKMMEEALALTRQTEDKTILPNLLNGHGQVLSLQGENKMARSDFEESLRTVRASGNRAGVSEALTQIATLDAATGNLAAARAGLEESIALKRGLRNSSSLAASLSQLTRVLKMQGDLAGARIAAEEQCSLRETLKEKGPLAACRVDLAELSIATAKPAEIRAALDKILAEPDKATYSAATLNKVARLWMAAGDAEKARQTIAAARKKIGSAADVPETAISLLITSARIDAAQGRTTQAIGMLKRAQSDAARFDYAPLALEARLAMAECRE